MKKGQCELQDGRWIGLQSGACYGRLSKVIVIEVRRKGRVSEVMDDTKGI